MPLHPPMQSDPVSEQERAMMTLIGSPSSIQSVLGPGGRPLLPGDNDMNIHPGLVSRQIYVYLLVSSSDRTAASAWFGQ